MILKLENNNSSYSFDVEDVNQGEKLFYRFEIPLSNVDDGKYSLTLMNGNEIVYEDVVCIGGFNTKTIQYERQNNVYINSPLEANIEERDVELTDVNSIIIPTSGYDAMSKVVVNAEPIYNNALEIGYNNGISEQKSKLEQITITENGTYSKEDGYNEVIVDVPDINGSYDVGYNDGYNVGYDEGVDKGLNDAGGIIAETARVLDVTENGIYLSQYSEPVIPNVTGYYDNGEPFYNYAKLNSAIYDTNIAPNPSKTKLEFWWKNESIISSSDQYLIAMNRGGNISYYVSIMWSNNSQKYIARLSDSTIKFELNEIGWYHFKMSKEDGLIINGEKIGDFSGNIFNTKHYTLRINGEDLNKPNVNTSINGKFGMIKITDSNGIENIIIPTENGFKNITTNELLPIFKEGIYNYKEENIRYGEGNLIKTINVNVPPKINVEEEKIRFGYSQFTEIPSFYDFSNLFNGVDLFNGCNKLEYIPFINTSNINDMTSMFASCPNLKEIPEIDTSNVTKMEKMLYYANSLENIPFINTSKVTNMYYMFSYCEKLKTIPQIDTSNVTNVSNMFQNCKTLNSLPPLNFQKVTNLSTVFGYFNLDNLTDVGGFINLKQSWNDNYGLANLPNLTYESCINILNGLYDFVGNGETPTSSQGKLKVHSKFMTLVGDEINIGVAKGWTISA